MKFICFTDWLQLPKSSNDLFEKAEKESLFFSRAWFENLTETALEDNQSLLLVCVVDEGIEGDKVLALLPLIRNPSKEWTSLSHRYSSLFSLLLVDDNRQEIIDCLVLGLKTLPFEFLTLDPVAGDDSAISDLQASMESNGFTCYRTFRFVNWFHQLKGQSFAKYMASRPSRVRNTIDRKQRKLEREQSYNIRLVTMHDGLKQALAEYHDLYSASWKAQEQFEKLVTDLIARYTEQGWTRLAILSINEKPVAAHLWFVVDKKASIFRLIYDQDWKQYSPGSVLMRYMLEQVIDIDNVEEIDFLTGNDRYKQDWMSESRERKSLICVNRQVSEKKSWVDKFLKCFKN